LYFGNIIAFGILGSKNAIDKNIPLNYINNSGNDNSLNNKNKNKYNEQSYTRTETNSTCSKAKTNPPTCNKSFLEMQLRNISL